MPVLGTSGGLNAGAFGLSIVKGPDAPATGLTVVRDVTNPTTQLNLSWTSGDATANTQIFRNSGVTGSPLTLIANVSAGITVYADPGKNTATTYQYCIRHEKFDITTVNTTAVSNNTSMTRPTMGTATAVAGTSDSITVTFTDTDASANLYISRQGPNNLGTTETVTLGPLTLVQRQAGSYTNSSIPQSAYQYTYQVYNQKADTGGGSTLTNTSSGSASAFTNLLTPTNLQSSGVTASSIALTWTHTGGPGIQAGTDIANNTSDTPIQSVAAGTYQNTISSLASGTSYSFRVRHTKNSRTSAYSAAQTFTTALNPPDLTGVTAQSGSQTQLNLSISDVDTTAELWMVRTPISPAATGSSTRIRLSGASALTSYSDTGLNPATQYSYYLYYKKTGSPDSAASTTRSEWTNLLAPAAPTIGATTTSSVVVNWAITTAGAVVDLDRTADNGSSWTSVLTGSSATTTTDSTASGTTYRYRLRYRLNGRASAYTQSANAGPVMPSAPTLTASPLSTSSIRIVITGDTDATCTLKLIRTGTSSLTTTIRTAGTSVPVASPRDETGLADGSSYTFELRYEKTNTGTGGTETSTSSPVSSCTVVAAPSNPSINIGSCVQSPTVVVSWTNNSTGTYSTVVEESVEGGAYTSVGTYPAGTTSVSLSRTSATQYTYRIYHSKTPCGSSTSVSATATTCVPVPTSPSASKTSDSTVALSWSVADTGAQTQVIRNGSVINTTATNVSTYTDTGLTPATQYAYSVRHKKNDRLSASTNPIDARPQAQFSGGNQTTDAGGYRVHTFTSSGTLTPAASGAGTIEYCIVAGGAGGGGAYGGGGGGGGVRTGSIYVSSSKAVTIGAGGPGGNAGIDSLWNGSSSSIAGVATATGGGAGGGFNYDGLTGGSGGGGGCNSSGQYARRGHAGAAGTSGQGNAGGNGIEDYQANKPPYTTSCSQWPYDGPYPYRSECPGLGCTYSSYGDGLEGWRTYVVRAGGGGGGAGSAGSSGVMQIRYNPTGQLFDRAWQCSDSSFAGDVTTLADAGDGGAGISNSWNGTRSLGGGGGGSGGNAIGGYGNGGGGNGGGVLARTAGATNTGGGGGAGGGGSEDGASGGSGIVLVRYPFVA